MLQTELLDIKKLAGTSKNGSFEVVQRVGGMKLKQAAVVTTVGVAVGTSKMRTTKKLGQRVQKVQKRIEKIRKVPFLRSGR